MGTTNHPGAGRFLALERAVQAAAACLAVARSRPTLPGDLASQVTRAAASVPLNLAEGAGRNGRDRIHHFRIAYASALEASAALDLLRRCNLVDAATAAKALALLDEVQAMTWSLIHPKRR